MLASQGLPSAAVVLGHVYIEGLGTKQDIPRAERYYQFAEKAGYEDKEFWFWKHYGVTLRQVTIPENLKEGFKKHWGNSIGENPQTCFYLVREKLHSPYLNYTRTSYNGDYFNLCNMRVKSFVSHFTVSTNGNVIFYKTNEDHFSADVLRFYSLSQNLDSYSQRFEFKK